MMTEPRDSNQQRFKSLEAMLGDIARLGSDRPSSAHFGFDASSTHGERVIVTSAAYIPGMDPHVQYRLDQGDKRLDALTAQLGTIQSTLADMRVDMARQAGEIRADLATKSTKGTTWAATAALAAIVVAVGALFWATSGNQLSAFQAGLSAIQTGLAVHQANTPPTSTTPAKP